MRGLDRSSGMVIGVIALALVGHAATLGSQWAINVDGSHSSLLPATPDRVALDLTVYYASTLVLIATYVALLALCRRGGIRGVARLALLATPLVLEGLLLIPRPYLSTDVLSYVAQGSVGLVRGAGNAYTELPRGVLGSAIGDQMTAIGWRPQSVLSPYGPLWTLYETVVARLSPGLATAVLLLKLAPVAASLASAALVWRILGLVRPRLQLLGTVAFLWNPVVIMEVAAEGHVDGVMTLFVLAAIWLALRADPVRAGVAGGLAAATKYIPLVLAPALAVYAWRTGSPRAAHRRGLLLGAVAAVAILAASFAPFWVGPRTLDGLRLLGQPGPWPTVTGLMYSFVQRVAPGLDGGAIAAVLVSGGFGLYLVRMALTVRDPRSLLVALACSALAFAIVGSPVFYPWYAVLPIALIALVPEASYLALAVALSVVSRVVAPLVDLRPAFEPIPAAAWTLTMFGLLACVALALALWLRTVWAWAGTEESAATAG